MSAAISPGGRGLCPAEIGVRAHAPQPDPGTNKMNSDITAMQALLTEIKVLLKSGNSIERRAASRKLKRIATMAETLSLTLVIMSKG